MTQHVGVERGVLVDAAAHCPRTWPRGADLLGHWLRYATVRSRDEPLSRQGTNAWEAAVRPFEARPKSRRLRYARRFNTQVPLRAE